MGFDFGVHLPPTTAVRQGLSDHEDGGMAASAITVNATVSDIDHTLKWSAGVVIAALLSLWLLGGFALKGVSI